MIRLTFLVGSDPVLASLQPSPAEPVPPYPNEVVVQPGATGPDVVSTVRLHQIRTVGRQRLIKRLGQLDSGSMHSVDEAIKISLGLIQL